MSRALLPPDDPDRATAAPTGSHHRVEDDPGYPPPWRTAAPAEADSYRPDVPQPSAPPVISVSGYRPLEGSAYAVVVYGTATRRVAQVVAPFADAPSAEQYAVAHGWRFYDVVPATAVGRTTP
jgi:hypothetical protein